MQKDTEFGAERGESWPTLASALFNDHLSALCSGGSLGLKRHLLYQNLWGQKLSSIGGLKHARHKQPTHPSKSILPWPD
jgi:hypothetical protein